MGELGRCAYGRTIGRDVLNWNDLDGYSAQQHLIITLIDSTNCPLLNELLQLVAPMNEPACIQCYPLFCLNKIFSAKYGKLAVYCGSIYFAFFPVMMSDVN
jgi:hypothetical protein